MSCPTDGSGPARPLAPYVALWLVVAAVVAGVAWHEIVSAKQRELADGRVEADKLARVLQQQVARNLEGFEHTLAAVKVVTEQAPGVVRLADVGDRLGLIAGTPVERRVNRFDRSGNLVDSTDVARLAAGASITDTPYFRDAEQATDGRMRVGEPSIGRLSGGPIIPLVMRLDAPNGDFDGVLQTALDPARLVQVFREIRVGERSTVGIADAAGHLYAWSAAGDAPPDTAAARGDTVAGIARAAAGARRMSDVIAGESIVARAAIPGTDLSAFAALPLDPMLADQRRYARGIVGFALLALLALSLPIAAVAARSASEAARRRTLEIGIEAERRRARRDPLTDAANRRAFTDLLERCHRDLAGERRPFVIAMIDVDRFKELNDTQGHVAGDRALQRIAETLMSGVRRADLVARIGGDEFAVVMPGGSARAMRRSLDAIFAAIAVAVAGEGWPISVSIGAVAFECPIERAQDAAHLADRLMYAVKSAGRNGVRYAVYRDGGLHPLDGRAYASAALRDAA